MQIEELLLKIDVVGLEKAVLRDWIAKEYPPNEYTQEYGAAVICRANMRLGIAARLSTLKQSYHAWLRSPAWRKIREQVLSRDHYRCRFCGAKDVDRLVAHHTSYSKGWDHIPAIITLCRDCHDECHFGKRSRYGVDFKNRVSAIGASHLIGHATVISR